MAETVFDGDIQQMNPPPKRRRILNPSAITPVPIYSNKVSSGLQLKPTLSLFTENENTDDADDYLWAEFSSKESANIICLSDSEEEFESHQRLAEPTEECVFSRVLLCPSPPPESPVQKQSRKVRQKTNEINRRLQAASSILSPKSRPTAASGTPPTVEEDDDDIIILETPGAQSLPDSSSPAWKISLKVRCRTEIHRVPVLPSTPLGKVLGQLSVILNVPPSQLLLLREEVELPPNLTVDELHLGIADIIDCVVMATEEKSSIITVRLQSKDRGSSQKFSIHREAPLASIFCQYLSGMEAAARSKARFQFDGSRVTGDQTAAQLDMEDGDIVEVWI